MTAPPGRRHLRGPVPLGAWWRRRSLRIRLTAAATIVIVVGMTAAAALLVLRLHAAVLTNLDDAVTQQVTTVAGDAARGRLPRPLAAGTESAGVVQVVGADGQVLTSSSNTLGQGRLFTFTAGAGDPTVLTVQGLPVGEGSGSYLVAGVTTASPYGALTVYAALPTADATRSIAELVTALALGVPVVTLLLAVIGWVLVGRALRPVDALTEQAAAIPGTALDRRLDVPPAEDELGRLATTLNALLARIETSAERQTRFVADAAHELRSPLAALRAQLEVAARHPAGAPTRELAPTLLRETLRLSRIVEDLLQLARLDAHPAAHTQPVDLDDIVLDQAQRARELGAQLDTSQVRAARVHGDPGSLHSVVRNLIDNATRHAHTTTTLTLRAHTGTVTLVVSDDGPGIAQADRARVFDRFTRLDQARGPDAGGSGLGLAIVRDVVLAHGGQVHLGQGTPGTPDQGLIATVTLPAGT